MIRDTAAVRALENFDQLSLARYLQGKLAGVEGKLEITQFPEGHSNLTYLLRSGGVEYVLRRAPLGPLPPRAHDMAREFALLTKLHPLFPLAPKPILLCEDPDVIGAVFHVMERRQGGILRKELPASFAAMPKVRERLSRAFIDCLAALHSIDIFATDLIAIGKPEGFIARQLHGWTDRWSRARTDELPAMDQTIGWLTENLPPSGPPAIVHNDFKFDNMMFDPADPERVTAVLDWEMATVGDPLMDLGMTLCYWLERGADDANENIYASPGWFSREEFLSRYQQQTGRDLTYIRWYEVFGMFKVAVILQQIYSRYIAGQTRDERFSNFHLRVRALAENALKYAVSRL